jgi:hypothetical protein
MKHVALTYVALTYVSITAALTLPPNRIFTGLSELESLVTSRAVFSTITQQVKNEIISESPFMRDISHGYFRLDFDLCYLCLMGLSVYIKIYNDTNETNQKLNHIYMYSSAMKLTRTIIFTLLLIMTKSVDNAI